MTAQIIETGNSKLFEKAFWDVDVIPFNGKGETEHYLDFLTAKEARDFAIREAGRDEIWRVIIRKGN